MKEDITKIATEKRNSNTMKLDTFNALEICEVMNQEDNKIANCIKKELHSISKVVEASAETLKNNGRIIYIGAGTSGRIGLLDAVECPPTFGVESTVVNGIIAGGEKAFIKAVEGAEDSEELAITDLKNISLTSNDIVIGIAASGRTPYVIAGLNYANEINAKTASIAITKNSKIAKIAQLPIEVEVGPEVLTGSTRLKSGTAQKMIVNMISTGAMVLNGKVYQNLMVDVQQTNIKLQKRAINIVLDATGCTEDEAKITLEKANGHVKTAIVMILFNVTFEKATIMLKDANGFIKDIK